MRAPHLAYKTMRSQGPLWQEPDTGVWFVLEYALAEEVMRNHQRFSSDVNRVAMRKGGLPEEALRIRSQGWALAPTLSNNDAASHEDYRKLVGPFFLPRRLRLIEPFILDRIATLLDAIDDSDGKCDFFASFAVPLPVSVIGEYLGMRHFGDDVLKRWSDAFADEIGFLTSDDRAVEIASLTLECHRAMVALCDERRGRKGEDVISALANAQLTDGRPLENGELLSILTQLLVAGNETTTATLGFALRRLAESPDLFELLRQEPDRISSFLEEILRLESPIQGQFRRAVGEQRLGPATIPDGTLIHVRFASANRDEQIWGEDKDMVRLDRKLPKPHMAFGNGIHFCVGAALSRLEMKLALKEILSRYRSVSLLCDRQELPFRTHFHQRGMTALPLEFAR